MGGRGGSSGIGGGSAEKAKMPELKGSEKQVRWANDIRSGVMTALDANVRNAQKNKKLGIEPDMLHASVGAAKEVRKFVVDQFKGQTSARAIIDNRDKFDQKNLWRTAIGVDRRKKKR